MRAAVRRGPRHDANQERKARKAAPKKAPAKKSGKQFHVAAGTAAAHERAVKAARTRKANKLQAQGYHGVPTIPLGTRPGQAGEPPLVGNPDYLEEMRRTTYRGGYYDHRSGVRKTYP